MTDELDAASRILGRVRDALAQERTRPLRGRGGRRSGLDVEDLRRLFAAAQRLAVDDAYGEADVAYARDLAVLVERSNVEVVERALRLRLRLVTQMVVNDLATIRLDAAVGEIIEQGGAAEELGDQLATMAQRRDPGRGAPAGRRLPRRAAAPARVGRRQPGRRGHRATPDHGRRLRRPRGVHAAVGRRRTRRASGWCSPPSRTPPPQVVEEVGEVLLAKTIGDAVLLVGGSPDQVASALLRVVEADHPELVDVERRAGMAYGEVLVREGDYVGTTVNTAARLTDLAFPTSLVVTTEASEALADDWQRSRLPPKHLKGLPTDRHVRIRWPEPDDG